MPSWRELRRFCENDGWEMWKKTDHYYYRKRDADGSFRLTRVSMGSGQIGHNLWRQIRVRQLCVSQEYFNAKL
jgi:hypothetical protein